MAKVKISSKMEESTWESLRKMSEETDRSISGLLCEAVEEYVARKSIRSDVLQHLEDSAVEHDELGKRLAK